MLSLQPYRLLTRKIVEIGTFYTVLKQIPYHTSLICIFIKVTGYGMIINTRYLLFIN
jgi:hypothetical protein